jgi:hypothetical protein
MTVLVSVDKQNDDNGRAESGVSLRFDGRNLRCV